MASEDVIELGSSDDETEPAPKKKKPTPNAMVHFPNKIPGLTIKPAKPISTLQKVLAGGAITIKNVNSGKVSTQVSKVKPNGKAMQIIPLKPVSKPIQVMQVQNNFSINPLSLVRNPQNLIRVKSQSRVAIPPGITVKRAPGGPKNLQVASVSKKRRPIKQKASSEIIPTVELDDEEGPLTSRISPQWYLRPEEQEQHLKVEESKDDEQKKDIETENNKEPETNKLIEITLIEDSPVKPVSTKRTQEVNSELAITIDDSPVKIAKEAPSASGSDSEKQSSVVPSSKKKLDYPREDRGEMTEFTNKTIEVSIEFDKPVSFEEMKGIESHKSPAVEKGGIENIDAQHGAASKVPATTKEITAVDKLKSACTKESSEFHPVYQNFIDVCFKLEDSDDMRKIVEKKIKTYYRQCPKEYVESEEFIEMVTSKIFAMQAGPDKMYLYIKDIVDELNLQRKTAKAVDVTLTETSKTEGEKYYGSEETGYDSKRQRQIRKLEKTLKKLHRAIQKLEEQEVEFEDEEDSVYLLTERYKERMVRVHAKFCQLTNTKMPSEPRVQIEARPGQSSGPAKRLEKWINRKVPIGTPLPFPDFHDVLRCVREANDEDRLGWNEADIMEEARDLFVRCGKKLQRRRQENEWRIAASRISHDASTIDPAEQSTVLKNRLEENKTLAAKKEIELLNKYADKQNQLKLVAEEIGDKEAEESPMESEEDEVIDDSNSLEDKQKRKERLRRLLTEKTRKASTEKETTSTNEPMEAKGDDELNKKEVEQTGEMSVVEEKVNDEKEDLLDANKDIETKEANNDESKKEEASNSDQKQNESNDDVCLVDSDVDELHLLQKLYSENELNSSNLESSDSDTPIAISDTLSDSETESVIKQQDDDIISIENSSYSESEIKDDCFKEPEFEHTKGRIDKLLLSNEEVELPANKDQSILIELDENILLASSDEDDYPMVAKENDKINENKSCHTELLNEDSNTNLSVVIHSENEDNIVMSTDTGYGTMTRDVIIDSDETNDIMAVQVHIEQNIEKNSDKIEVSDTTSDEVMVDNEGDHVSQETRESVDSIDIKSKNKYDEENVTRTDDDLTKNKDTCETNLKFGSEVSLEKEKVDCNSIDSTSDDIVFEKEEDLSEINHTITEEDTYNNKEHNYEKSEVVQDSVSNNISENSSNSVQIDTSEKDLTKGDVLNCSDVAMESVRSLKTLSNQQITSMEVDESSSV